MCSDIAHIFGYANISCSGALRTTIDIHRISLARRLALAEDLTQENIVVMQTNLERVSFCHILQGDPKNRCTIIVGSYSYSEHVHEYSNYLAASIFPMHNS
jgi:hypothetical protein